MKSLLEKRIEILDKNRMQSVLAGGLRGLEKESLRVAKGGGIAQTRHPQSLGSALTHPWITTDYSEALPEFITPPLDASADVLDFLQDVQTFVYQKLEQETLWATSMPCVLKGGSNIPVADYGLSNRGMMKTVYRRGLGYRYGRVMQVISGVHFNYSLPEKFWTYFQEMEQSDLELREFRDRHYMGLIRNLQRFGWLIPYLMGASPAVCKSFFGDSAPGLDVFDESTYYEPYATSLRMGDIGYQNSKEEGLGVKANYDSLADYTASLRKAITTPAEIWEKIGVEVDGYWRQLNANILQIENEYYSTVRPKPLMKGLEKPVDALNLRGIEYIELRSLDVNAYHPLGIDKTQLDFLEIFVLFCLLKDSPVISLEERQEIDGNILQVAHRGRAPSLKLRCAGRSVYLSGWGERLLDEMRGLAEMLDQSAPDPVYSQALDVQLQKIRNADETPSARMLQEMRENGESFYQFAERMSVVHRRFYANTRLSESRQVFFEQAVADSLEQQKKIESGPQMEFARFLQQYEAGMG